jgi:Rrf2 family transcriptional regulator, iron-sulfur cluster assembly transcription factor
MRLTTKGRYAVMAMTDIAHQGEGKTVCLSDISDRLGISLAYLEQLFGLLRKAGLVNSMRGPGGGYRLDKPIDEIKILDIIQAVDEPLKATRCSPLEKGCMPSGGRCATHALWEDLGFHIDHFMRRISLEDVLTGNTRTEQQIPYDESNRHHHAS